MERAVRASRLWLCPAIRTTPRNCMRGIVRSCGTSLTR
jgi:hypothetical protein